MRRYKLFVFVGVEGNINGKELTISGVMAFFDKKNILMCFIPNKQYGLNKIFVNL
jgi:hypothetical protein